MPFPRFARDPLVVFAAIGGVFFLAYHFATADQREIQVSRAVQASLSEDFEVLTGKTPTAAERQNLIDDYVGDEILFREAVERGMHLTDKETKQRLIDKMRFLVAGAPPEPTEEQLIDFYSENIPLYRSEPKITFDHVYFKSEPDGAPRLLKTLNTGGAVAGDEFWMGRQMTDYGESMVRGMFGQPFLKALDKAPKGDWVGPITSIRGVHFVRVHGTAAPALMPYPQVRDQVRQDWTARQIESALVTQRKDVEGKYDVVVEP